MRCYRRILNNPYKDHITNEEVHSHVWALIDLYEELLTTVKKRKPRWYGHVSRSSSLAQGQYSRAQLMEQEGMEDKRRDGKIMSRNGLD